MRILLVFSLCLMNFSFLHAQEGCDALQEGAYDEEVEQPCKRRPNHFFRGHYIDEQDPTEELEQDTSWPSRNEEFSDQLFTPNGGPW